LLDRLKVSAGWHYEQTSSAIASFPNCADSAFFRGFGKEVFAFVFHHQHPPVI
jgi:hypothetical protein